MIATAITGAASGVVARWLRPVERHFEPTFCFEPPLPPPALSGFPDPYDPDAPPIDRVIRAVAASPPIPVP